MNHSHGAGDEVPFRQLSLFPFDAWGGGPDPVVRVYQPVLGIAHAAFAPVWCGFGDLEGVDADVHFFAVTNDGLNVIQGRIKGTGVVCSLEGLLDIVGSAAAKPGGEQDCLETWLDVRKFGVSATGNCQKAITALARARYGLDSFSIDEKLLAPTERHLAYERYIVVTINERIETAISWVLQGLHPMLLEVLTLRPRLSLNTARALFDFAGSDVNATRYVTQALRTESLALLNLLVEGDPEIATPLVKTLLSGGSLPSALLAIGVSKAGHRRSLRSDKPEGRHFQLANIPMKGEHFLRSQRALTHFPVEKWPQDEGAWQQFIGMVNALPSSFSESTANRLMEYCWAPTIDATSRMVSLVERISNLQTVAAKFGEQAQLEHAVDAVLSRHPNAKSMGEEEFQFHVIAKNRTGVLAVQLAAITDMSLKTMASGLLHHVPLIPDFIHHGFQIHELSTLDELVDQGHAVNNCLRGLEHVMSYIPLGVTVFSVRSVETKAIVGTLALKVSAAFFFKGVTFEKYQVEYQYEKMGIEPPPLLEKAMSECIAILNSLNNVEWLPFADACEAWREKAGIEPKT